jgi:hypothetical protein
MAGETTRRSEGERVAAGARGPLARLLLVLTIAACLCAAATGVYGIYNFPDAPIRLKGTGYVGKGGGAHTREEFDAFVLWERAMFIAFPLAFLLGAAFAITDTTERRRHGSEQS